MQSNQNIERIKQTIPIRELVEAHGVDLERRGADWHGRCPFHSDRTPSLVVSPKKNLWHCLGACNAGGSVIDWVMKTQAMSFVAAVKHLEEMTGARQVSTSKAAPETEDVPAVERTLEDEKLLLRVVEHYHATLLATPAAVGYLEDRGLRSAEMIERFRLGFSDGSLRELCPVVPRKESPERRRLRSLGVFRASGHEHFEGSLIIPVFDERGAVLDLYGRRVHRPKPGMPAHLYLPGPHRGVFNLAAFSASKELILCESLIDALTFWCAGFRNVTSSFGVNGFTEAHLVALKRHGVERVLVAYDRDEAGDRAAEKLAKKLDDEGLFPFRVEFPKGMDANEYAKKLTPADKSLGLVLNKARYLGSKTAPERARIVIDLSSLAALDPAPSSVETMSAADALPPPAKEEPTTDTGSAFFPPISTPPVMEKLSDEAEPNSAAVPAAPSPLGPVRLCRPEIQSEVTGEEVRLLVGERNYRVRGLFKNLSIDLLRVNLLAAHKERFFVDTLDLYSAKQRGAFSKQAASDLELDEEVLKKDLGKVLLELELLQEAAIQKTLAKKDTSPVLSQEEREEALALLRDENLLDRIVSDLETAGVVGERENKLLGYLACVSRKLDDPLAIIVQSSSAAGKSALLDAVLTFMPDEDRVKYSAMTGQSLFYMGETNLSHKILAIIEEEGATRASYALKLLQTEHELTIASTGKDPETGRLVTHEYRVKGPVMIFLTTTQIDIDDELLNRCLVLSVDEARAQTQAIHRLQRKKETLEGLFEKREKARLVKLHHNAQRLLLPLCVVNPFAEKLTFFDHQTRSRRDHMKYLVLIRTIALCHQMQRTKKREVRGVEEVEYIEATMKDIEHANRLADMVLGHTLDELPPHTRKLLDAIESFVQKRAESRKLARNDVRFSRRELREATGLGNTQLKTHLERLEDLEYICARQAKGRSLEYELLYDGRGKDGAPFLSGLLDLEALEHPRTFSAQKSALSAGVSSGSEGVSSGANGVLSAPFRGGFGPLSGGSRGVEFSGKASADPSLAEDDAAQPKNALKGQNGRTLGTPPSAVESR